MGLLINIAIFDRYSNVLSFAKYSVALTPIFNRNLTRLTFKKEAKFMFFIIHFIPI